MMWDGLDGATSLGEVLRRTAARTPDAVALVCGHDGLTYAELDERSDRLASRIGDAGVASGGFVGVLADRSASSMVAMLAVLKSGNAYVPLDPGYPARHLEFISRDSGVTHVVGSSPLEGLPGLAACRFVAADVLDSAGSDMHRSARDAPTRSRRSAGPSDPAYVIYTSGSTGMPKGCVVTHGNVLALLRGTLPLFDFSSADRWSQFHSSSFDFSVWEMWGAFASGGAVMMVSDDLVKAPAAFVDFLIDRRISVLSQVPSVFRYVVRELAKRRDGADLALRHVVLGGEEVDLRVVADFLSGQPGTAPAVTNMYGITETTVHATFKRLSAADTRDTSVRSPIGRALPHLNITLHDTNGDLVAPGEIGEMWISGPGVADGYLRRPELTEQRFLTVPGGSGGDRTYRSGDLARTLPSGELEYVGRNDDQVKIMGFRIELGEVEHAFRSHPAVTDAVVVAAGSPTGARSLVACITSDVEDQGELRSQLREHLSSTLAAHMIPGRIRVFGELPRTASGKTDRRAIRELLGDELGSVSG